MKSILAFGDMLWDLFPSGEKFGGAAANFSCHSARLGAKVHTVSGIGSDDRGKRALKELKNHGVCTDLVQVIPDVETGYVSVDFDSCGQPKFTIGPNAAWGNWEWNQEIRRKVSQADALYFDTLGQCGEYARSGILKALEIANREGVLRVLDINLRPPFYNSALIENSLNSCDLLKVSEEELGEVLRICCLTKAQDPIEGADNLRNKYGISMVALTRGEQGAVFLSDQVTINQEGFPVEIVDTVGAGDSFIASLTVDLLNELSLETSLRRACKYSSQACTHTGAIPELEV